MKRLRDAFAYAISGLGYAVRTQRTLRIHLGIAALVGGVTLWLHLSSVETAVMILAITLVIATEVLNTSAEAQVDLLVERNHHAMAKLVKDIAAGAVLATAIGAAMVGVLLLGPPLALRVGIEPTLATLLARGMALAVLALGIVALIRVRWSPHRPHQVSSSGAGHKR